MNIVLVNNDATLGGAAYACKRLLRGFSAMGHSASLIAKKIGKDEHVVVCDGFDQAMMNEHDRSAGLLRSYGVDQMSSWHFSLFGPHVSLVSHPLVQQADVINLHWVTDFLSPESVAELLSAGKTVVWTLHDQRPFTGGCHYAGACRGFESSCENCPQLLPDFRSLAQTCLKAEVSLLAGNPNLTVVTPSRWLAEEAKRSKVFQDLQIVSIPNEVDWETYCPASGRELRRRLGWSDSALVVVFGSHFLEDRRKGFDVILSALTQSLQDPKIAHMALQRDIIFAAFGNGGEGLLEYDLPVQNVGLMKTEGEMAELFQAADLFVCASRADNLPNTIMEAMACGLPVLASSVGGIPEMVENGVNGRLCTPDNSSELAKALNELLSDRLQLKRMGEKSRQLCERNYAHGLQAKAYTDLFQDILANKRRNRSFGASEKPNPTLQTALADVAFVERELRRRSTSIRRRLPRAGRQLIQRVGNLVSRKFRSSRVWRDKDLR